MKPYRMILIFALASLPFVVHAEDGHDHGDTPAAVSGNSPKRQADGSVFLPKPAQRQFGVRTLLAETGEMPKTLELSGKVVMDPNTGGRVQAMVAGRVTPGPRGLLLPGQTVNKGEVLAYVTPEVGGQSRSLSESRLRRLRDLSDTVPRKMIEEAEAAVANEQLRAPVSGVIASTKVVSGQVAEAREVLFEIVDPERLMIEALSFDMGIANEVNGAFIAIGGNKLPLRLLGTARILRDQALPLLFGGEGASLSNLAVGQPIKIYVHTRSKVRGIAVPLIALMKNPSNQTIVWVKAAPERFEPRVVTTEALDGESVAVTSGLKPGERVAARAATLINQIR